MAPPVRGARRGAGWTADRDRLPTSVRAVLSYFARGGRLDLSALRLRPTVEDRVEAMVREAFDPVEAALAEEFGVPRQEVRFEYDTKLLMPAELALARRYRDLAREASDGFDPVEREVNPGLLGKVPLPAALAGESDPIGGEFSDLIRAVERAEEVTRFVVAALLDGDMRDAINDDEYGDFRTTIPDADPPRVARVAQSTLAERVEAGFERYPDEVRAAYDRAVATSEAHQDRDERFRSLLEDARDGDPGAEDRIRAEYRDAGFEDPPDAFRSRDLDLPYFRSQYARVGVIYTGMIEMYRAAGVPLDEAFERSVVLAIVGAQVWLDDVDDFEADMREGQLTPVTAEYLLADSDGEAHDRVVELTDRYLDRAREYADASDSTLNGIAVEYIHRSGNPDVLPR
ncbi:hypothetical protein BRD00_09990 [Halobacteriales archaeon QS_8_69_26]|nr:MAG: hypothetical protein BRD00_09990 [Halobacteriales archaeon QS_8_69_26]